MTYQTVPQPADPNAAAHFFERYRSGDKLPNSGRLRISVAPERATVEYLRAGSPLQQGGAATPDQAAFRYELLPRPQP